MQRHGPALRFLLHYAREQLRQLGELMCRRAPVNKVEEKGENAQRRKLQKGPDTAFLLQGQQIAAEEEGGMQDQIATMELIDYPFLLAVSHLSPPPPRPSPLPLQYSCVRP